MISEGGDEISRISWAEYYRQRERLQETLNRAYPRWSGVVIPATPG